MHLIAFLSMLMGDHLSTVSYSKKNKNKIKIHTVCMYFYTLVYNNMVVGIKYVTFGISQVNRNPSINCCVFKEIDKQSKIFLSFCFIIREVTLCFIYSFYTDWNSLKLQLFHTTLKVWAWAKIAMELKPKSKRFCLYHKRDIQIVFN